MLVPHLNVTWLCSSCLINVGEFFILVVKNGKRGESTTAISHFKLSFNSDHYDKSQSATVKSYFTFLVSWDHYINRQHQQKKWLEYS